MLLTRMAHHKTREVEMTLTDEYRVVTAKDDFDLVRSASSRIGEHWPEFMLHDPVAEHFPRCYDELPEFQFVLTRIDSDEALAIGNSIPISFDDDLEELSEEGWDWAMTKGMSDLDSGAQPNYLCALQVVVFCEYSGEGLSRHVVDAMKRIGRSVGLHGLMAPVRPSLKNQYPLTDIDRYIKWVDEDGMPFDPWMRVHRRLGARIIKPCHSAMRISDTVSKWEEWTRYRFPESGSYIIPGALVPVEIDVESNTGTYIEPNVWMFHPLE